MLAEEKEFQSEAKMPYTSKIDEDMNLLVADFCYPTPIWHDNCLL